jgi:MoxR-like ATPase
MQDLAIKLSKAVNQMNQVILGKPDQVKLCFACLIAKGHLLIEDLPGMGKTTLSHGLANVLGLSYNRIQFTNDLLPSDLLGVTILNQDAKASVEPGALFEFHKGAIFSQVVLTDEINRASPKTQSALLEAMEEHQVSIEGKTYDLPEPFFVIATQNPFSQSGTYPLPESQLDRFLMRITLGYPPPEAERELLKGISRRDLANQVSAVFTDQELIELQSRVKAIKVSDALLDYVQKLVAFSRTCETVDVGLSPRGSLSLLRSAQAWAMLQERDYVIPEDIQAVLASVVDHRVISHDGQPISRRMLAEVSVI